METKLAFETMTKILPDVVDILNDDAVQDFKRVAKRKDKNNTGEMMKIIIPMFSGNKRDALIRIISAVTGKSVETVEAQDFKQTIQDMNAGFVGDMMTFFVLCVRMVARA